MASIGSLLKKTIFRVFAFAIMVTVGSFVFSILERKHAENTTKSTKQTLANLRKEMATKYNMTDEEFDSFSVRSHEVLGQVGSPKWDYVDSLRFAFETLTTIGKEVSWYCMFSSEAKIVAWELKNQLYASFIIS